MREASYSMMLETSWGIEMQQYLSPMKLQKGGKITMGAWGSGLYGNDTTCDVRDTYMGFLKEQLSNQEAYEKTLKEYEEDTKDPEEAPLFWYALAETQWKVGRLMPEVKGKALEWIEKEGGMVLWEESKSGGSGWKKTLEKLRIKLETEQPKEKKIKKPVKINQNLWNIGDVYAYHFHTEEAKKYDAFDKYMIIQKIGADSYYSDDDLVMSVHVFDRLFDKVPTLDDLKGVRLLPFDYTGSSKDLRMNNWLALQKKREYPEDHLTFIGNMPPPANVVKRIVYSSSSEWFSIESWGIYFQRWQGLEYETVEEGVFKYTHKINQNLWNVGDVYAYYFHTEKAEKHGVFGKYMIIQKIGEEQSLSGDVIMSVHVFDKLFDKIPTLESLEGLRLLPFDSSSPTPFDVPGQARILCMNSCLALQKESEYPEDHLTFIGNMSPPANVVRDGPYGSFANWLYIENWSIYFQRWQGVEYETVEEGVFGYIC